MTDVRLHRIRAIFDAGLFYSVQNSLGSFVLTRCNYTTRRYRVFVLCIDKHVSLIVRFV